MLALTNMYDYEVFISYSHRDSAWVTGELMPRLERWGVRACVDYRDFAHGCPVSEELRRLLSLSRQVLIVLSRNWFDSQFVDYELQLTMALTEQEVQRVLPLRISDCEVPDRLRRFQVIDSIHLGWPVAWSVLRRSLFSGRRQGAPGILAVEMDLRRSAEPDRCPEAYQYVADVLVGNPHPVSYSEFDCIDFSFCELPTFSRSPRLTALRVPAKRRAPILYSYHGVPFFSALDNVRDESEGEFDAVKLDSQRGTWYSGIPFSDCPPSRARRNITVVSVSCKLAGEPVANSCSGALPPLLRTPEMDDGDPFHLVLANDRSLPSESGALVAEKVDRAFATASHRDPNALLVSVSPEVVSTHQLTGGDRLHSCQGWRFIFHSVQSDRNFAVPVGTTDTIVEVERDVHSNPSSWLSKTILGTCGIDCKAAYLLLRSAGAKVSEISTPGKSALRLECRIVESTWRPVWVLPFEVDGTKVGVLADSLEVVRFCGTTVTVLQGVLWNSS
jgi:hypothetical protein